jgi:hypothetical protein
MPALQNDAHDVDEIVVVLNDQNVGVRFHSTLLVEVGSLACQHYR